MTMFDNGEPEDFFGLLKIFKTKIYGTGTTLVSGIINYLHMMLSGEVFGEFYE